jgi:hypothetical protein
MGAVYDGLAGATLTASAPRDDLGLALELIELAAGIALPHFRNTGLAVETKPAARR